MTPESVGDGSRDSIPATAATFNSAHLGRVGAQQRAEMRTLICFTLAAVCLGTIIGLLIGYATWGTVEVICGG